MREIEQNGQASANCLPKQHIKGGGRAQVVYDFTNNMGQEGAREKECMDNRKSTPPLTRRKNHPRSSGRAEPENRCTYLTGSGLSELRRGVFFRRGQIYLRSSDIMAIMAIFLSKFNVRPIKKSIMKSAIMLNRFAGKMFDRFNLLRMNAKKQCAYFCFEKTRRAWALAFFQKKISSEELRLVPICVNAKINRGFREKSITVRGQRNDFPYCDCLWTFAATALPLPRRGRCYLGNPEERATTDVLIPTQER